MPLKVGGIVPERWGEQSVRARSPGHSLTVLFNEEGLPGGFKMRRIEYQERGRACPNEELVGRGII